MSEPGYRETLDRMYRLRRFGIRPGLEPITRVLASMGEPQRRFPSIHIAGSKGKGSVAAMTESILSAHGLKVGLFTSPHLKSFRERIQVNRELINPPEAVVRSREVETTAERLTRSGQLDRPLTFFEETTAMAFAHFAHSRVDVAIVEVGLGGRLDSTNVVSAPVGVVTSIEFEHTEILGATLPAIAREKAGIFKPGMRAIRGELEDSAAREVDRAAAELGIPIWRLGQEIRRADRVLTPRGQSMTIEVPGLQVERTRIPLFGPVQASNAVLATAAARAFALATDLRLDIRRIRSGLSTVRWRGRLERLERHPNLYADVAHTVESARAAAQGLGEIFPLSDPSENVVVFGCLVGKPIEKILDTLSPLAQTLVAVPVRSERSASVDQLRRAGLGRFPRVVQALSLEQGLRLGRAATAFDGFTLVVGSDYLVGELLELLEGRAEDEPDLSDPGISLPPATLSRS